jgi:glycosyltransferase involved in cell wall biosynthesis
MSDPRISVVIPCYNAERYVGAAVRSVMAQGVPDVEVVVVDDGSTDGSVGVVRSQFPAVKLVTQANAGVAAARNKGVASAAAPWIAFLDADDLWLPGKLHAQLDALGKAQDARMCYSAWHVWNSSDMDPAPALLQQLSEWRHDKPRWTGASGWIYPELLMDCVVWTSTVLMHRDLFLAAGGFQVDLRVGEDYDLWLRLSRVTPIVRICEPAALYRMHPTGLTRSRPTANYKGQVVSRAIERWGYAGPDGRLADKAAVHRGLARSWSDYAGAQLMAGQYAAARASAWTALGFSPAHLLGWKVLAKALALGAAPTLGRPA